MRARRSTFAFGVSCLGLGASLASLIDYVAPEPTFCAASGCATVKASAWAHPLGVPMPVLGVAFFGAMVALAVVSRPKLRLALALAGGAFALALVGIQAFAIGAWCKLCLVSDTSAAVLAIAVVAGAGAIPLTAARGLAGSALAFVLPLGFAIATASADEPPLPAVAAGSGGAQPIPDIVARAQKPGTVTVMEFVDFECPFCRRLAPELSTAVGHAPGSVTVIRKMVPLPMHPHARTAALAWSCADAQGKGDAMADALFAAPPDTLTPEGCEHLAEQVGCDLDRYRQALADPATGERVDSDLAEAKAAGANALPTIFIGTQRFTGAAYSADDLLAAIDRASH